MSGGGEDGWVIKDLFIKYNDEINIIRIIH